MNKYILLFLFAGMAHLSVGAHVAMKHPLGGETFMAGDTLIIHFRETVYHGTQSFELTFSGDSGLTYTLVDTIEWIDTIHFYYDWIIPDSIGDKFRISVLQVNDAYREYTSATEVFTIKASNVSVNDKTPSRTSITLSPNPTTGPLNIDTDQKIVAVSVFDIKGNLILREDEVENVDLSSYPAGTYIVRVQTSVGIVSKRIIISK